MAGRVLVAAGGPGPADAVVVLSGDPLGARVERGVEALGASGAARLVVSLQAAGPVYDPRDDLLAFLAARGVPESSVRLVGPATSTAEEAGLVAGLARRCGWGRLIVVTSPYHSRRAGWLFRRVLPGTDVTTVASDQAVRPWTWWAHGRETEDVLLEWVKGLSSLRHLFVPPDVHDSGVPC